MANDVLAFEVDGELVMVAGLGTPAPGFELVGVGDRMVEKAQVSLETAVDVVRPAANAVLSSCKTLIQTPDIVEVKLGEVHSIWWCARVKWVSRSIPRTDDDMGKLGEEPLVASGLSFPATRGAGY